MASPQLLGLVRPRGEPAGSHSAATRRALSSAAALVALAGLVAIVATQGGGRPVALVGSSAGKAELAFGDGLFRASLPEDAREGSVRAGVRPHTAAVPRRIAKVGLKATTSQLAAAALKFGDAAFTPDASAASKEGAVRDGKRPDFSAPLGDLGETGLVATPLHRAAAKLAFGDAAFRSNASPASKEGSVRGTVTPDFTPPLGDLGKTGLVAKPSRSASRDARLAFGDAAFTADEAAAAKEGSVRGTVTPDFTAPLGDLGKTGLVAKPIKSGSALKFGDSAFTADESASAKEGSVRGSVKPDFSAPLGDLGKTGLVAKHAAAKGTKLGGVAARAAADSFFDAQKAAIPKSKVPVFTDKMESAAIGQYYDEKEKKEVVAHQSQLASANKRSAAAHAQVGAYYKSLEADDERMHQLAVQRQATANSALAQQQAHDAAAPAVVMQAAADDQADEEPAEKDVEARIEHKEAKVDDIAKVIDAQEPAEAEVVEGDITNKEAKVDDVAKAVDAEEPSETEDFEHKVKGKESLSPLSKVAEVAKVAEEPKVADDANVAAERAPWQQLAEMSALQHTTGKDGKKKVFGFQSVPMAHNPKTKKRLLEAKEIVARDLANAMD